MPMIYRGPGGFTMVTTTASSCTQTALASVQTPVYCQSHAYYLNVWVLDIASMILLTWLSSVCHMNTTSGLTEHTSECLCCLNEAGDWQLRWHPPCSSTSSETWSPWRRKPSKQKPRFSSASSKSDFSGLHGIGSNKMQRAMVALRCSRTGPSLLEPGPRAKARSLEPTSLPSAHLPNPRVEDIFMNRC